jgi:hypothetical protein
LPPGSVAHRAGGARVADRQVYVAAGFCRDDVALTYLAGVMARSGIDDPAFHGYIGQVTMRLFPVFNEESVLFPP